MNFTFTEEQDMIRQAARDYAEREIIKDVQHRDETCEFPDQHIKQLAVLGMMGMLVDTKYGGAGMDTIAYVLAIEEISKIDPSVGVILSVNNSLVCQAIEWFGTQAQKEKILTPLARGEQIGAFMLTEPASGSDASSLKTTAIKQGEDYLISGTKHWITNAGQAAVYLVFAQTDKSKGSKGITAFLVAKDTPGITLGPKENKMGMRSSDTHSVHFEDVRVPASACLGAPDAGFGIAMQVLEGGRIGIAAQALGIAEGAYNIAEKYARERITFGQAIINHQAIAFKLADMASKTEAARLLTYKSAWLKDQGLPFGTASAMAKLAASEAAMYVTTEAVQILGAYGYVKEYHVERLMRDAKLTQIYEGTSEIQRIIISRAVKKQTGDIFI